MIKKVLFLVCFAFSLTSCQFTETMVLYEDGSGTIAVEVNMSEMMAFGDEALQDSSAVKMDTIINVKQFLEEKKDSIALLSKEKQMKLKKMERFNIRVIIDSETSEMKYSTLTSFKDVSEANDIANGLSEATDFIPDMNSDPDLEQSEKEEDSPEIIGVNYSFEKGIFKRDAYIKDVVLHQREVDSLQEAEAYLGSAKYTLKYTFPRPIKKASDPEATLSNDKKSLTLKKGFIEYYKNPDLLDLEVELEK